MLQTTKFYINGLKDLQDLEEGKIVMKLRSADNMNMIMNDLKKLLLLEGNIEMDHDDLKDHDDIGDVSLINLFPNSLLIEDSILSQQSEKTSGKNTSKKNSKLADLSNDYIGSASPKPVDIWDILNQTIKENKSESIDLLSTDKESTSNKNKCKNCQTEGSLIEDQKASIIVCSKCGMVNEEILDHGPEWRQYNNEDNRNDGVGRCGCPSNYYFPKSSQGTIMAGSSNSRLKRKQKWNSMVYKERSLNTVFKRMANICSNNNIPKNIVDTAEFLYKKLSDCGVIIRGDNRKSIIAACIFKSCDINKNPRTIKEIAAFFNLEEKKVTRGIKHYEKIMKKSDIDTELVNHFNPDTAEDYIRRHCSNPKLKISKNHTNLAVKISNNCSRMKLASDHNPQSIAAGSILVMINYCDLNIDKKEIAKLFKTSDATIGKIYKKIISFVDALVDDDIADHIIEKFKVNG